MTLHHVAWFGPVGAMLVAQVMLDRRWKAAAKPGRVAPAAVIATASGPCAAPVDTVLRSPRAA